VPVFNFNDYSTLRYLLQKSCKYKTINQNSIFVLTGYAESQHVIVALNTKHPVYLKSGRQKIRLQVSDICIGQFYLTQAILKPETPLEAGLEYILCIDNLPEYEHLDRYNSKTESYEPISYTVSNVVDTNKPELFTQAKELKKTIHYYGCGPAKYVVFSNPAKDSSEIIIKTTVKNLKTMKETTYYIEPDQEVINVGYGMCSGAFTYVEDDEHYEIEDPDDLKYSPGDPRHPLRLTNSDYNGRLPFYRQVLYRTPIVTSHRMYTESYDRTYQGAKRMKFGDPTTAILIHNYLNLQE
jgi:hypothetical protein